MEFIKTLETENVIFEHNSEKHLYKIKEVRVQGERVEVNVTISKKIENDQIAHLGYISIKGGTKSLSFPKNEDLMPHLKVLDAYLGQDTNPSVEYSDKLTLNGKVNVTDKFGTTVNADTE